MKCIICGKEFSSNFPNQITCSPACRHARVLQNNRNSRRKRDAEKRGKTVAIGTIKKCVVCGKDFTLTHSKQVCCSDACRAIRYRKHQYNYDDIFIKKKPTVQTLKPVECHNCGKQFTPSYKGEKFCSDKCRFQFFHLEDYIL